MAKDAITSASTSHLGTSPQENGTDLTNVPVKFSTLSSPKENLQKFRLYSKGKVAVTKKPKSATVGSVAASPSGAGDASSSKPEQNVVLGSSSSASTSAQFNGCVVIKDIHSLSTLQSHKQLH